MLLNFTAQIVCNLLDSTYIQIFQNTAVFFDFS